MFEEKIVDGILYLIHVFDQTASVSEALACDQELVIPDTVVYKNESYPVTEIDRGVFREREIESVVIPNSVTVIGKEAFAECYMLSTVVLHSSVTCIYSYAFANCESLTEITFNGTIEQWKNIDLVDSWNYNNPAITVHCSDGDIKIEKLDLYINFLINFSF